MPHGSGAFPLARARQGVILSGRSRDPIPTDVRAKPSRRCTREGPVGAVRRGRSGPVRRGWTLGRAWYAGPGFMRYGGLG